MEEKHPNENIHTKKLENYENMNFRCIKCGYDKLSRSPPRVFNKEINAENVVCEDILEVNDMKIPMGLFVTGCFTCEKCNNKMSVTILDHGNIK